MKTRTGRNRREMIVLGVIFAALFLLPLLNNNTFRLQQYEYIVAVTLVAIGLNIVVGYAGQLVLGPGGIFGIAGYAAAVFANDHPSDADLILLCLLGLVAASVAGLIIGAPALRVGGFYLGMATLAIAVIVPSVASVMNLTGASTGISLLSNLEFSPKLGGVGLYELCVGVLVIAAVWSWLLLHSRVGHRFQALANSEDLAASLGVIGFRTKLLAFVLSAWPAGVGAAIYVYTQQFFVPDSADPNLSIYVLAACIIGGVGSVLGPILGSLVVFGINEFLGGLAQWQDIVFGVLLAGFAILCPEGIVGLIDGTGTRTLTLPPALDPRRLLNTRRTAVDHGEVTPRRHRAPATTPVTLDAELAPSSRETPSLNVSRVSKTFGAVRAVDDVSLTVAPGTVHALIGSNGSGKTTVLNLISGFYRIDGGQITLGEARLDRMSAGRVAHLGIARTFQAPKLILRQTLLENVAGAASIQGGGHDLGSVLRTPAGIRAARHANEVARDALEETGLGDFAHELVARLPHGLRRLGEVARALAVSPSVLLLDEPAAGLTHSELESLDAVIRRAAARGTGVLLVEHNVPFVFRLAEEITVLHLGQVISTGTPEQIRGDDAVAEAFLGSQRELIGDVVPPPAGRISSVVKEAGRG